MTVPSIAQGFAYALVLMRISRRLIFPCLLASVATSGLAQYIAFSETPGSFRLAADREAAPIYVDGQDWPGVIRATRDLQSDLATVTGARPSLSTTAAVMGKEIVIVGTVGKSSLVDGLARTGKIDIRPIQGKWESYVIQVVPHPLPGVERALVVAGSDKRGTIYGVYDISEKAGVSAWSWWADLPVHHHPELYVKPGRFVQGPPAVRYRGIFLNDEAPSLSNWVYANFGEYRHKFYEHVFELLLRLKANYLWPAMWNNCFSQDDPLNPVEADEYGIVMGTSHVEPMMRADKEWNRKGFGPAEWNFDTHSKELIDFWTEGIERNKPFENIVTIAMRGKIDTPMSETANIALLEKIVAAQRKIIAEHVNPDVSKVPQLWCLYKEVQEYYEKGMRVPDDVTLLWSDDNWGDIRRLPTPEERKRSGGAGVYYHFDYVGDPRNYKWLNTNPIPKVWEQMHTAYAYGADRIWIVNVGDLKPMEFPMEFFLRLAWDPNRWTASTLGKYTQDWAERSFGPDHSAEIAQIIEKYTKYNGRRKPELLEPGTYSLVNYHEAETVVSDYNRLADQAEALSKRLPDDQRDAYFQLVLYPVRACAIVNELYVEAAKNHVYAAQGRPSANLAADKVKALFQADADLVKEYHTIHGGKWNHMMDQTHIGYTYWQQPDQNNMPALKSVTPVAGAELGVAVEGSESAGTTTLPPLSVFDREPRYFELFNRGTGPLTFEAKADVPWLKVSATRGSLGTDVRVDVSADWHRVPAGSESATISVTGSDGHKSVLTVPIQYPASPRQSNLHGFVETDGCVSIEAEHYSRAVDGGSAKWLRIPDFGRTLGAMTITPPTAAPQEGMRLDYEMFLFDGGPVTVEAIFAPTQQFRPDHGFSYAIGFDDEKPQVVDFHAGYVYTHPEWQESVRDSVRVVSTKHAIAGSGYHTLRFFAIDPGLVLEKLVVNAGGVRPSYLGPPESPRR